MSGPCLLEMSIPLCEFSRPIKLFEEIVPKLESCAHIIASNKPHLTFFFASLFCLHRDWLSNCVSALPRKACGRLAVSSDCSSYCPEDTGTVVYCGTVAVVHHNVCLLLNRLGAYGNIQLWEKNLGFLIETFMFFSFNLLMLIFLLLILDFSNLCR